MKRINLFFIVALMIAAVNSCNLEPWEDLSENTDRVFDTFTKSKIYKGGNVTCDQVGEMEIFQDIELLQTTGRNDYNPAEDSFAYSWPEGLVVKVNEDGSISFQIDGSINLGDGLCYMVGAVIVKGSAASNIYAYPSGAAYDINLEAPDNSSGTPAGLSNLTFCFVECEEPKEIAIAVKFQYYTSYASYENQIPEDYGLSYSDGMFKFVSSDWCDRMGINLYPETSDFLLQQNAGTVHVEDLWLENTHYLMVTIDLYDEMVFLKTFLFAGDLNEFGDFTSCPEYWNWLSNNSIENTHVYLIPYDELI